MANITTMQKVLDIVQVAATQVIPRHELLRAQMGFEHFVSCQLPANVDALVLTLVGFLAADPIEKIEIKHPSNWWEAFKEEYAPQMFIDRFPVRYKHHYIDLKMIWRGYQPPPGCLKYGAFLPYVLQTSDDDTQDY